MDDVQICDAPCKEMISKLRSALENEELASFSFNTTYNEGNDDNDGNFGRKNVSTTRNSCALGINEV